MNPFTAVKNRKIKGGPAPEVVEQSIKQAFDLVALKERNLKEREGQLTKSRKTLLKKVDSILGG